MATTKSQRIGILIILIALIVGTIGSFAVLILGADNAKRDSEVQRAAYEEYTKNQTAYQAKVDAQTKQLAEKYYPTFQPYNTQPAAFDKDSVKELSTNELVVGEGTEINGETKFAVYYIGWNSDGKAFDQSIENNTLKAPLPIDGLDSAGIISGWKEGIKGMKIGGIRQLTIPSDKAYGEAGQGDDIPPNSPLKFVVMAIEKPAEIPQPEIPEILLKGVS